MMQNYRGKEGFTLVEILAAATIFLIVVSMSTTSFIHILKGANEHFIQDELDVDVQKAMEYLKRDLRLTSIDEMYFYPPGEGEVHTAVSFPLGSDERGATAFDPPDGAWDLDAVTSNIDWNVTVIYHVYEGDPHQFRKTIFTNRVDSLTGPERLEQLRFVSTNGSPHLTNALGVIVDGTYNYEHGTTRVIFENLFNWTIREHAATIDLYAEETNRLVNANLGSLVIESGAHLFTFSVIDKHDDSSGYRVGIDSLFVSGSGSDREAEFQHAIVTNVGPLVTNMYMSSGGWDANYQLMFPATATGQYFTLSMSNDVWEDETFLNTGYSTDNADTRFDTDVNPKRFVVEIDGKAPGAPHDVGPTGDRWRAYQQTYSWTNESGYNDGGETIKGYGVRVIMKGDKMDAGGFIPRDAGQLAIVLANGGTAANEKLVITDIYVGECADASFLSPDMVPGTVQEFGAWPGSSKTINYGSESRFGGTTAPYFAIDKDKSYVVSFIVANTGQSGHAKWWYDNHDDNNIGCYIITAPVPGDASNTTWSGRADLIESDKLFGLKSAMLFLPTNAIYISGVFDTQMDNPGYTTVSWEEDIIAGNGSDIMLKVRSSHTNTMSTAPDWSSLTALTEPAAWPVASSNERYMQWRAEMLPNFEVWPGGATDWAYTNSPKLRSVAISWPGPTRSTDFGGTFTIGPDFGKVKLLVDGKALKSGVLIDLKIFESVVGYRGKRSVTSRLSSEVKPRNSGK